MCPARCGAGGLAVLEGSLTVCSLFSPTTPDLRERRPPRLAEGKAGAARGNQQQSACGGRESVQGAFPPPRFKTCRAESCSSPPSLSRRAPARAQRRPHPWPAGTWRLGWLEAGRDPPALPPTLTQKQAEKVECEEAAAPAGARSSRRRGASLDKPVRTRRGGGGRRQRPPRASAHEPAVSRPRPATHPLTPALPLLSARAAARAGCSGWRGWRGWGGADGRRRGAF